MHLRDDIAATQTGPNSIVHVKSVKSEPVTSRKSNRQKTDSGDILDALAQADNASVEVEGTQLRFSSLHKVLWPGAGKRAAITKGDYVQYLYRMSPYLLPHLHNRPLTLIRYPDGLEGQRFFQKHWNKKLPEFVDTVRHFSEHTGTNQDYLVCNNLPTLLWLAQMAVLEMHTAHSRIDPKPDATGLSQNYTDSVENIESSLLNYPDYMVLDLDPYIYSGKEARGAEPELNRKAFHKACSMALSLKKILDGLQLDSFIKTSGKTGLHIYVPIVRNIDTDTVRELAATLGRHMLSQHPRDITIDWAVKKRTGKIFFDFNMNGRAKTLPAPYCLRNSMQATVSTPLSWDEVDSIYPTDFTIRNIVDRVDRIGDLWTDILQHKNNLLKLLPKR